MAWSPVTEWLPMRFGSRPVRTIRDPIVEPLWPGRRVLIRLQAVGPHGGAAEPTLLAIRDEDGLELAGEPDLRAALFEAGRASALVLDGYLLDLPRRDAPVAFGGTPAIPVPGLGDTTRALMLGTRRPGPERPGRDWPPTASGSQGHGTTALGGPAGGIQVAAFVAVDVLAIDTDELLDLPLLERKRLLDSVIAENERVRRGPHVRPPAESWYGQWRAFGFGQMAVKSANSRYLPGQPSPDWAIASLPRG